MSLSTKTVLVIDKGLYLPLARKIGESAAKVKYYLQDDKSYPDSPLRLIGTGFEEAERIYKNDLPKAKNEADLICFFDTYDGAEADDLREKGHTVFACGQKAEQWELDRVFFMEQLAKLDIAFPFTYRAEGMDDAIEYLKGRKNKWLKTSYYRGDFETYHFRNMKHAESWLDDLRYRIGERAKTIEILIQDNLEAECEVGYDGFCIDGVLAENGLIGYEIKDKGYICRVTPETPEIIKGINDKIAPLLKRCRGHLSTEVRITKNGTPHFTDITPRAPSPPNELMCELYSSYTEDMLRIAEGNMPKMKERAEYGAEIILQSPWHEKHQIYVEFPDEISQWVKLKNCMKNRKGHYCIPNGNGGYFGAVVAYADTVEKAMELCKERAGQIEAEELSYESNIFDKANEQIEGGKPFGIKF
jgi:hypothetical protein